MSSRATEPILTGEEVRRFREELALTQEELATKLGFRGVLRRQRVSKIETGVDSIDYVRANLLLAMASGYQPTGDVEDERWDITKRQAEALWAARHEKTALNLRTTEKGRGGGFRRMLKGLQERGLLGPKFQITPYGDLLLDGYLRGHKLNPRTKGNPTGRWA